MSKNQENKRKIEKAIIDKFADLLVQHLDYLDNNKYKDLCLQKRDIKQTA